MLLTHLVGVFYMPHKFSEGHRRQKNEAKWELMPQRLLECPQKKQNRAQQTVQYWLGLNNAQQALGYSGSL